jgi:hypothetical protein
VKTNLIPGAQGTEVLQTLIKDRRDEYKNLTTEEREKIVVMFEEAKATETTAMYMKASSKVNDITSTLLMLENAVRTFSL